MNCVLFSLSAVLVAAQGPGNGLSKTTYAASDPLPGMLFLMKLLNNTAAEDSGSGNYAKCGAETSGQPSEWLITMGRSQLIESEAVGTCRILHGKTSMSGYKWGPTAMTPPTRKGQDCAYHWKDMTQTDGSSAYTVASHNKDTCCKACAADPQCTGAVYNSATSSSNFSYLGQAAGPQPGEGFGMHLTAIPGHTTTGGLAVEEVEAHFTAKLATMEKFDWFMDYNVGLFTSSLDAYLLRLKLHNTSYLAASWPAANGSTWYSVFIHVPGTQMVVELMGSESNILDGPNTHLLEQRMTDTRIKQFTEAAPVGMIVSVASVSRAASDLTALEEFYTSGVGATVTQKTTTSAMSRLCICWPGAKGDVCFTKRAEGTTAGSFKPKDFETMLHTVHATLLTNPNCAMDRWVDNHYAVDLMSGNFDGLMNYVKGKMGGSDQIYYTCGSGPGGGGGAHYVFDPSGWGIQLDVQMTVSMPGCASTDFLQSARSSPWCDAGTCDKDAFEEFSI